MDKYSTTFAVWNYWPTNQLYQPPGKRSTPIFITPPPIHNYSSLSEFLHQQRTTFLAAYLLYPPVFPAKNNALVFLQRQASVFSLLAFAILQYNTLFLRPSSTVHCTNETAFHLPYIRSIEGSASLLSIVKTMAFWFCHYHPSFYQKISLFWPMSIVYYNILQRATVDVMFIQISIQ